MPLLPIYDKDAEQPIIDQPGTSSPSIQSQPSNAMLPYTPQVSPGSGQDVGGDRFVNFSRVFGANKAGAQSSAKSIEDKAAEQAKAAQANLSQVSSQIEQTPGVMTNLSTQTDAALKAAAERKYTGVDKFGNLAGAAAAKTGLGNVNQAANSLGTWAGLQAQQEESRAGAGGSRMNAALAGSASGMFGNLQGRFGGEYDKAASAGQGRIDSTKSAIARNAALAQAEIDRRNAPVPVKDNTYHGTQAAPVIRPENPTQQLPGHGDLGAVLAGAGSNPMMPGDTGTMSIDSGGFPFDSAQVTGEGNDTPQVWGRDTQSSRITAAQRAGIGPDARGGQNYRTKEGKIVFVQSGSNPPAGSTKLGGR